ncbi:hypothetical protein H1R20_g3385, partial [Candolleomyces eurysporus]
MYANTHLGFVAIGVQLCLCYVTFLAFQRTPIERKRERIPFMALAFVLTSLYILHAVADSISYSGMMISQRQRRIELYLNRPQTAKRITISTAAEVVTSIIGNGILLYRCYVIWHAYLWVLIVPVLIYLTSIAMSILYLISGVSLRALASLGGTPAAKAWGTAWFILSVAVNALVTSLICFKLLRAQGRLRGVLNDETVQVYTSVVAILVESALPFTVLGVVAGVINALGYQVSSAFDEAWFAFCVRILRFLFPRPLCKADSLFNLS